jgi:phthalate 4,5-dioxygenase
VTHRDKDLPTVMLERFGDVAGFVGRPRNAAAE